MQKISFDHLCAMTFIELVAVAELHSIIMFLTIVKDKMTTAVVPMDFLLKFVTNGIFESLVRNVNINQQVAVASERKSERTNAMLTEKAISPHVVSAGF